MGLCKKQRKQRAPLKPRQGPYKKVNAYTTKPSMEQIATFILGISILILHSIFEVKAIIMINHPILFIMLGFHYVLMISVLYFYYRITNFDPVDRYIIVPNLADSQQSKKPMSSCDLCRSKIHQKSYHCKRCNRCTQDFDHHCTFLNSCIGSRNYELFLSLLLLYVTFMMVNIGESSWVFVAALRDPAISRAAISEWVSLFIAILCILQFFATGVLLGFHCYISCFLDLTTIAFIQSETQSKKSERSVKRRSQPPKIIDSSPMNFISVRPEIQNPTLNSLFPTNMK